MEAMTTTLKGLRHDLGAKDAELAITKAEAEAFRRQLIPGAGSTLHGDTEVLSLYDNACMIHNHRYRIPVYCMIMTFA